MARNRGLGVPRVRVGSQSDMDRLVTFLDQVLRNAASLTGIATHTHQSDTQGGKLDHGAALNGLPDDDHTQYILAAGTRAFTGDQSMGGNQLTNLGAPGATTDAVHAGRSIATSTGLTGGGNLTADRTLSLDIDGLTAIGEAVDLTNDTVPIYNASGTVVRKVAVGSMGLVPDTRTVGAGDGLAGGGDLSANRTLSVDISPLSAIGTTDPANDLLLIEDVTDGSIRKVTPNNLGLAAGAPTDAQYVTLATNGTLSAERVLTEGSGIDIADAGAGGAVTVAVDINGLTADGSPDGAADYVMTYDASAGTNKKVLLDDLPGGGGGGGDWTLIDEQSGAASSYSFTSIPGSYRSLVLVYHLRCDDGGFGASYVRMTINGDTGTSYDLQRLQVNGTSVTASASLAASNMEIGMIAGPTADTGHLAAGVITIPDYANSTTDKAVLCKSSTAVDGTFGLYANEVGAHWNDTDAITQIDLTPPSGDFTSDSVVSLYGLN